MTYRVEITETLQRIVEVEADTIEEAVSKVEDDYASCDIILDSLDMKNFEIKEYKDA